MSRSRSRSSSASPSPSLSDDNIPSTSYRIERFVSAPTTDLMVTSRSKRSTAGNRLKALLDQELEKDEVFAEVENDIDFEANENDDGVDIVDSDFDRDSDDDARVAEDESEGEREIKAQEKADKQKRRAQARAVGIIKKPTAPAIARRPAPPSAAARQEREAKRRRISFAPDEPPSRSSPGSAADSPAGRRTSRRSATVQSKLQVESRLEEAQQRRAAQPIKVAPKKKASLTQDALIAEALEVEEENRESLRRFLEQEEERRAKQRQRKARITGPFVRWMSVGLKTRVVEEVKSADDDKEKSGRSEEAKSVDVDSKTEQISKDGEMKQASVQEDEKDSIGGRPDPASERPGNDKNGSVERMDEDTSVTTPPPRPSLQEGDGSKVSTGDDEQMPAPETPVDATKTETAPASDAPATRPASDKHVLVSPAEATSTPQEPRTISAAPAQAPTISTASLTLDPAIAARHEASLLRTYASASKPSSSSSSTLLAAPAGGSSEKYELQARTLLSVERMPEDWEWLDEFNALLGTHCSWDAYPFVPSRNRPLKPRQSICPITGLPAIYKDPRTGIAYANAHAYKIITKLLHNRFVWTGGHYEQAHDETRDKARKGKEKEKEKEKRNGFGGKVGTGAAPPEMGIYVDDEQEKGPGEVWEKARAEAKTKEKEIPKQAQATLQGKTNATPQPTPTKPAQEAAEAKKAKSNKPGFDVVLTNAIAPGDEKAVLAAALSLPAGSTRSGRRVQRS